MTWSLEEKQQYYKYPASGWTYKTPPTLRDDVIAEMARHRLDEHYRFIWLGVDIVRLSDVDPNPVVRGDTNACRYRNRQVGFVQRGRLQIPQYARYLEPKKPFVYTRQPHKLFYLDDDGHRVEVARPEFAPPNKVVQIECRFHAFGYLEWRMEELVAPEVARASGSDDGWVSIGTIKAKDGSYNEPSVLHVFDLLKRRHEDRNLSKKESRKVAEAESAQRDEDKADETLAIEAAEEAEVKEFVTTDFLPYLENRPHTVS